MSILVQIAFCRVSQSCQKEVVIVILVRCSWTLVLTLPKQWNLSRPGVVVLFLSNVQLSSLLEELKVFLLALMQPPHVFFGIPI